MTLSIRLRASSRELADISGALTTTLQDIEVLVLLDPDRHTRQTPSSQLQRRLLLTSGALAHRLDKMEAAGTIRRVRVDTDRRQILVEITPHGQTQLHRVTRELGTDLATVVTDIEQRLRQALPAADQDVAL